MWREYLREEKKKKNSNNTKWIPVCKCGASLPMPVFFITLPHTHRSMQDLITPRSCFSIHSWRDISLPRHPRFTWSCTLRPGRWAVSCNGYEDGSAVIPICPRPLLRDGISPNLWITIQDSRRNEVVKNRCLLLLISPHIHSSLLSTLPIEHVWR